MSSPSPHDPHSALSRSHLLAWGTVRAGLGLTFFGALLVLLSAGVVVVVALTRDPEVPKMSLLIVVALALAILGVLSGLVQIFSGVCMTAAAPRPARTWGRLAAVCGVLFVLLCVVLAIAGLDHLACQEAKLKDVVPDQIKPEEGKKLFEESELRNLAIVCGASFVVGTICYLLALRAIAASVGRRGVAAGVVFYLLLVLAGFGGLGAAGYMQATDPKVLTADEIDLAVKAVLGGLLLLGLWGMMTVALVRRSVRRGLLQAE